jgi:hypothetical protein
MDFFNKSLRICLLVASVVFATQEMKAFASEPGWSPVIIARGEYREQVKSLPMELRPYRPLHFYGNTARRIHYRGTPLPAPRDILAPISVTGSRLIGR